MFVRVVAFQREGSDLAPKCVKRCHKTVRFADISVKLLKDYKSGNGSLGRDVPGTGASSRVSVGFASLERNV